MHFKKKVCINQSEFHEFMTAQIKEIMENKRQDKEVDNNYILKWIRKNAKKFYKDYYRNNEK